MRTSGPGTAAGVACGLCKTGCTLLFLLPSLNLQCRCSFSTCCATAAISALCALREPSAVLCWRALSFSSRAFFAIYFVEVRLGAGVPPLR